MSNTPRSKLYGHLHIAHVSRLVDMNRNRLLRLYISVGHTVWTTSVDMAISVGMKPFYSLRELSVLLGVSKDTVGRRCKEKMWTTYHVGKKTYISIVDVQRGLRSDVWDM